MRIDIHNRQELIAFSRACVRKALRQAGEGAWADRTLSVAVVDQEEMAHLNRRFTARDGDTDVLAFALDDDVSEDPVVGEIIVCASRALREAQARGVDPREELLLYLVHGAAHLLGYDDHSPEDRKVMYAKEDDILRGAGIRNVRKVSCKGRKRGPHPV
jgi:probable rRNA maturation factor